MRHHTRRVGSVFSEQMSMRIAASILSTGLRLVFLAIVAVTIARLGIEAKERRSHSTAQLAQSDE
jgi:hypothetical protein